MQNNYGSSCGDFEIISLKKISKDVTKITRSFCKFDPS